jgi:hypothetical protein
MILAEYGIGREDIEEAVERLNQDIDPDMV